MACPPSPGPSHPNPIPEAALGAFGLCFPPSPSFLEYPRRLQPITGHPKAQTLLGGERLPGDQQVRTLPAIWQLPTVCLLIG